MGLLKAPGELVPIGTDAHFHAGTVVDKAVDTYCLLSLSNPSGTIALLQDTGPAV